jgi:hypothetical protein
MQKRLRQEAWPVRQEEVKGEEVIGQER